MISEADFAATVTELEPIVESVNKQRDFGELTTFEILTAVVFAYFKKNRVDFQVLEVGLGGRLDATNVVKPDVCVITSLSLDHTEILGNTIAKIAAEKSGIIKPGCIVINAPQVDEAAQVVNQVCHQQQAKLIQVGQDVTWNKTGGDLYGQTLTVSTKSRYYDLTIPLLGDYQLENAATAVAAIEALVSPGTIISSQNIAQGFSQVNWPGRLQILSREPMVVVDGAHNAYSMSKLVQAVIEYFNYKRCFVIFGTSCDKDISGMAQELKHLSNHIIITSSSHPRAASIPSLAERFNSLGIKSVAADNVAEALSKVLSLAKKTDLILATGSLFVVAEAIDYIAEAKSPVVADDIK
jgi:dihydrofolate synthase/folylpolyglutamate synthase